MTKAIFEAAVLDNSDYTTSTLTIGDTTYNSIDAGQFESGAYAYWDDTDYGKNAYAVVISTVEKDGKIVAYTASAVEGTLTGWAPMMVNPALPSGGVRLSLALLPSGSPRASRSRRAGFCSSSASPVWLSAAVVRNFAALGCYKVPCVKRTAALHNGTRRFF